MREIVLYPGESITIGDTFIKAMNQDIDKNPGLREPVSGQRPTDRDAIKRVQEYRSLTVTTPPIMCFCVGPAPGEILCPCVLHQRDLTLERLNRSIRE